MDVPYNQRKISNYKPMSFSLDLIVTVFNTDKYKILNG